MKPNTQAKINIVQGDITRFPATAIVNAANEALRGGGGVDGAIHRAAGHQLLEKLVRTFPQGMQTGQAVYTPAYNIKSAKFIIHTVAPIYKGGEAGEMELLAGCYRESLKLARKLYCTSVAFPSLGTGVYGNPIWEAASVAIRTMLEFGKGMTITMVCFSEADLKVYQSVLQMETQTAGTNE